MSFSAIIGQDKPIGLLKTYIENSCLEGGYLFSGAEGIGKKMVALALARKLNCLESRSDSCGQCGSCLKIDKNQHPDVHIISDEDAQIKIEAIRQLQKDINLKAYEGNYKVFIIDNAHNLTAEAANCLLKVLEEPPRKTLIILISDKPNLLFKTVTSRCKVLKFLPLEREALEEILKNDYKLDASFAHFLAYFSEGRLGRALKLKEEDTIARKNNLIDRFVLAPHPGVEGLASASRIEVRNSLNLLATCFRDIYILKTGLPEEEVINSDRKRDLAQAAARLSFSDLDTAFGHIATAITWLDRNVNIRLLLLNLRLEIWPA